MKKPKAPVAPAPTADELRRQEEAARAAADASARAAEEKRLAEERARYERNALSNNLRGNRSLLSAAGGAAGFPTTLGGA